MSYIVCLEVQMFMLGQTQRGIQGVGYCQNSISLRCELAQSDCKIVINFFSTYTGIGVLLFLWFSVGWSSGTVELNTENAFKNHYVYVDSLFETYCFHRGKTL